MFRRLSAKFRVSGSAKKQAASRVEVAGQEDQSLKWLKAIHEAQKEPDSETPGARSPDPYIPEAGPSLSPSQSESDFLCDIAENGLDSSFLSPNSSPPHFGDPHILSYGEPSSPRSPPLSPSEDDLSSPRFEPDSPPDSEPSTPDSSSASAFELEELLYPRLDAGVDDLNSFLRESRFRFEERAPDMPVKIVMGNQAADLDSIVASIAYARLLATATSRTCSVVLPLLNIPRADLTLRTETVYLFSSMGLRADALLFLDDVDLDELYSSGKLQLVLVDHNRLAPSQEHLSPSVVEIVDHHEHEGRYPWVEERLVEPVGSCCTLIAERISTQASELLQGRGLSKLLLSAILLDTLNLEDTLGTSTEYDEIMAALLMNGAGTLGRYGLFELLRAKRLDQSELSTADLLRKDYMQSCMGDEVNVGISIVGLPLRQMASKDQDFKTEVKAFAAQHGLTVLIIMSMFYDVMGNVKRQIAIVADDEELVKDIAKFLASPAAGLRLTANPAAGFPDHSKVYNQTCLTASREQVQPLLRDFFGSKI